MEGGDFKRNVDAIYNCAKCGKEGSRKGPFTHDVRTSALRGRGVGSKADNSTDGLREWDSNKGEGFKSPKF